MALEPLELRDHRYRAQKALSALKEDQAEQRKALEEAIAHYQQICAHQHAEEHEGTWRCRDCDLQKTTAAPEPEVAAAAEPAGATEPATTEPAAATEPEAAAKPEAAPEGS
jgi:hypothetical protein